MPRVFTWVLICGVAAALWSTAFSERSHAQSNGVALLILDETQPQILTSLNGEVVLPDEDVTGVITLGGTNLTVPGDLSVFLAKRDDGTFTGFAAQDQSHIEIESSSLTPQIEFIKEGSGESAALLAAQQSSITHAGTIRFDLSGTGDAILAFAADDAVILVDGNDQVSQAGNGSAIGARATQASRVHLSGQLTVSDEGNFDSILAFALDDSEILIDGTGTLDERGNGQAIAFAATDRSRIEFRGSFDIQQEGPGSVVLVEADNDARVLLAGDIDATSTGPGFNFPPVITRDNAVVEIVSGRLASSGGLGQFQNVLSLANSSSVVWSGGEIDFGPLEPFFSLNNTTSLVIKGTAFNRPTGLVSDLSGSVEGILSDGTPFSFDFERSDGARVFLVPEPVSLGMVVLAIGLGAGTSGSRRRRA